MEGQTLTYRAYEDIPYVTNPVDDKMERLSIFVPEVFYEGKSVNGYNLENAPIFLPNTIGGYMPGPQERPGKNIHGKTNATFFAAASWICCSICGSAWKRDGRCRRKVLRLCTGSTL